MIEINTNLVEKLIQTQFPKYAHLPICPVEKSGHDNRTFHLGDNMTVRLPSGKDYASQVEKECFWLPKIAKSLSIPISSPVEIGEATCDFPYNWSINKWIDGDTVTHDNIDNLNTFAKDLSTFLKNLQLITTLGGPIAGEHNFYRGGDLAVYHEETQSALQNLKSVFPVDILKELWNIAISSKWQEVPVWVHGDVAIGNLLVKDGKLCGVIDFGILGVGDPACDYVMAWTFFDKESRKVFFNTLGCDKNTKDRAMGWALWKALIVYDNNNTTSEISQWAKRTIDEILEDYMQNI
jgi:aminoglycoside phosphotransferase (APT) family kinase protein